MFNRASFRALALLVVMGAISSSCPVQARETRIHAGDKVVTTDRAPVYSGQKEVLTLDAGTELIATDLKGEWVGVEIKQDSETVWGWIHADQLAVQKAPPAKSKTDAAGYPRELSMQSLPAYRIEPPDTIQIEMLRMVPVPPYRLDRYDLLLISVRGALLDTPIQGRHRIDGEGTVNLGAPYGSVRVAGMTAQEASDAITQHLRVILKYPGVSVQLAEGCAMQPVNGKYLVLQDGTVDLRFYGAVHVAGKTLVETKIALEKHLSQLFDSPEVSVEVSGYNSKVYYIITESASQGDRVVRVPITGNETVLDAISHIQGLSALSSRKIWVARPAPPESGMETVLPVDWEAITRRGATATNYQIFPGDRIFIAEDSTVALTNSIARHIGPAERVLGLIGLGTSIIRNLR